MNSYKLDAFTFLGDFRVMGSSFRIKFASVMAKNCSPTQATLISVLSVNSVRKK